jgi:two-component system sensor histidine kinase BaeS
VLIALATILVAGALAYPLSRRLSRPVAAFQTAARRLADGDFTARVPVSGDDELGRLGRDINALAESLERNEHARRRWVADISHELRTPLAVLRAEIEALQDGVRPLERAAVDSLHGDVLRLGRLVDDLYELSMTDLGALSYRKAEMDPAGLLEDDIDTLRGRFAAAGLELTLDNRLEGPARTLGDAHRLSQLFRNLLRNSLQYTDRGGALRVTLSRDGDRLLVDFRDTAPGVPPESLERLFERLYRVDSSRSRNTGGAGLGLAICRNIAEAHGGNLEARPAPEGGLWIRLTLPLA